MKKGYLIFLIGFGFFGTLGNSVNAAELKAVTPEMNENATELFGTLEESDSILKLPDGGYLHGEAYDVAADDPNKIIATYNSETDSNETTVGEVIDLVEEYNETSSLERVGVTPRVATPPKTSSYRVLQAGGQYWSQAFSGSGWQFSGLGFLPAAGTGKYLGWQASKDDGNVGGPNQANSTWGGVYSGSPLYVSAGYSYKTPQDYHPGFPYVMIFYSYNPVPGSTYYVANI